jgi:uncharacterized protein (TIGR00299 family) protein
MRVGYLHCFSGISGDMFLGALVHAGVSAGRLQQAISALGLAEELRVTRVDRSGISATKVDVVPHEHHHAHDEHHHHGRSLSEIRGLIERAALEPEASRIARCAFELLGEAEAHIHNVPVEEIHFHEVGAVDAIVDIVCTAVGCRELGVERWVCSPVNVGGGTVECAHGTFPVPAPATLELLRDAPMYSSGVEAELVTPTGAALLRALGAEFSVFPAMRPACTGYGAGSRDLPGLPNVLRLTVGKAESTLLAPPGEETVAVLETTVDDASPQLLGYAVERALAEGALDAFSIPVQMKKSRPGILLTVLCRPEDAPKLRELLLRETTTLGVRLRYEQRACLGRRVISVETRWGEVRVKIAIRGEEVVNVAPEFEDCRRLAEASGVPVKDVIQDAVRAHLESRRGAGVSP